MSKHLTSLERLQSIGFRCSGSWALDEAGGIKVTLTENAQTANALYAFVLNEDVVYVGKTTQQLRRRLYGYQNPRITQRTNVRGNKAIFIELSAKKKVDIFVLADNGLVRFGGFHLNLAAALEDSLINDLRPLWNKRFGREDAKAKARAAARNEV